MSSYFFNREEKYITAWGLLPMLKALNEAISEGFEIDYSHPYTLFNDMDFSYKIFLKERASIDESAVKKALLAYAKILDPETNGQKYKTVDSLLEKINAPSN